MPDDRSIDIEVEVPGTPEEVWRAIATGPGISSWYVPHEVEETKGGTANASFGPGPEMTVSGRVAEWEPLKRVVFDGGDGGEGMAFEWLVEAKDGSCVVRLINSGFGTGDDWDAQFDAMNDGWRIFLFNLELHLRYFKGQTASASLPMANWPINRPTAWARLTEQLGIDGSPSIGDKIVTASGTGPKLSGTVHAVTPERISLLLDHPSPGTAFIAAEGSGENSSVSIWSYLYGPDANAAAERDQLAWGTWLAERT